ncbi:hypothetical protein LTR53_013216, partial [Teratosphaeriaceae sp. CCFEE 6253]
RPKETTSRSPTARRPSTISRQGSSQAHRRTSSSWAPHRPQRQSPQHRRPRQCQRHPRTPAERSPPPRTRRPDQRPSARSRRLRRRL